MPEPIEYPQRLSQQNLAELAAARQALLKIRRAVNAARIEGYTIAIFGGLSLICGLNSLSNILVSLPLAAVGIVEIYGADRLRRLQLTAVRLLTINQLILAALIILYGVCKLIMECVSPGSSLGSLSDVDLQQFGDVTRTAHLIGMLLYGSIVVAGVFEIAMARYYHSREEILENYLAETPSWITALQKQGITI